MLRVTQLALAIGTAVENTVTEGSVARKIFAAYELTPGKAYQFDAVVIASATNATDTLIAAVRFGTSATPTANTACATGTAVDVANGNMVVVRGILHVQSATRAVLTLNMNDAGADGTAVKAYSEVLVINPAVANYLDITAKWSVASAGNVAACDAFGVFELS